MALTLRARRAEFGRTGGRGLYHCPRPGGRRSSRAPASTGRLGIVWDLARGTVGRPTGRAMFAWSQAGRRLPSPPARTTRSSGARRSPASCGHHVDPETGRSRRRPGAGTGCSSPSSASRSSRCCMRGRAARARPTADGLPPARGEGLRLERRGPRSVWQGPPLSDVIRHKTNKWFKRFFPAKYRQGGLATFPARRGAAAVSAVAGGLLELPTATCPWIGWEELLGWA